MLLKETRSVQIDEKQKFARRGFFAGLTAFAAALSLTPFSPAHAASLSSSTSLPQVDQLSEGDAQKYISAAVSFPQYQQFKQQTQSQYAGSFTFQEQNARAWRVTIAQDTFIAARIPIDGGAGNSFYVANFAATSTTIASTQSILLVLMPDKNVRSIATANSQQVLDAVITPEGNFVSGTAVIQNKSMNLGQQNIKTLFTAINAASQTPLCCLENALVIFGFASVPLVAGAAILCASVCVATLGGACLPCIGGAIGVGLLGFEFLQGQCTANPDRYTGPFC